MIRVGIAGIGFMGMVHYLTWRGLPGAEVVAVATPEPERRGGDWRGIRGNFGPPGEQMDLTGVATFASAEELIEHADVDLVDVTLPPALHAHAACAALTAGRHVFCEKPMALTLADCDTMLAAAEQAERRLFVGHVLPYFPEYAWALEEVRSGRHGRLLGGSLKRIISDPQWLAAYWDADRVGGPMLDLHVHDAHFLRLLFGMPAAVTTRGTVRGGLPELWHTLFEFEGDGPTVHATSGVIPQQGRPFLHGFEIRLERATLLFEFAVIGDDASYLCPPTLLTDDGVVHRPELGDGDPMLAFRNELADVVRSLERNGDGESPGARDPLDPCLARDAIELCHRQSSDLLRSR